MYRARDTKLGREVALEILPAAFASDPDRLMRFEFDTSGAFRVGPAEMLLPPRYYGALSGALVARTYDVTADG